jgi:hypothetical protein
MFNLDIFKPNSYRAAVALGAIVGVVTFSASATVPDRYSCFPLSWPRQYKPRRSCRPLRPRTKAPLNYRGA